MRTYDEAVGNLRKGDLLFFPRSNIHGDYNIYNHVAVYAGTNDEGVPYVVEYNADGTESRTIRERPLREVAQDRQFAVGNFLFDQ